MRHNILVMWLGLGCLFFLFVEIYTGTWRKTGATCSSSCCYPSPTNAVSVFGSNANIFIRLLGYDLISICFVYRGTKKSKK